MSLAVYVLLTFEVTVIQSYGFVPYFTILVASENQCAMGYSRKNPHPPDRWGHFSTSHLTRISWSPRPPLLSGFPTHKTPPPTWISGKKGVKVNQFFTFFTSIITQNNWDLTWNYSTVTHWVWVRVKISQAFSNSSLQLYNVAMVFSIFFAFSAIKGPVKELKLSFMLGEKYANKIFVLFSGSESAKVSPN